MPVVSRRDALSAPPGSVVPDTPRVRIKLDVRTQRILVGDSRLFGPAGRSLGRQFVETLCSHPGVRRAEIDVRTSTCRIDFDLGIRAPRQLADIFIDSLRAVSSWERRRWWPTKEASWSSIVAYRHQGDVSTWQAFEDEPHELRLVHKRPWGRRRSASELADRIAGLGGVRKCEIAFWSGRLTISLDQARDASSVSRVMGLVEAILEGRYIEGRDRAAEVPSIEIPSATGWRILALVAVGGGALRMDIVGLILPGLRAVPYLLVGSYFLARSWPGLDGRLRRAPLFGPILHESSLQGTSQPRWSKDTFAGFVIIVVAQILIPLGPVAFALIVLISSLGVFGLSSTPAPLGDRRETDVRHLDVGLSSGKFVRALDAVPCL